MRNSSLFQGLREGVRRFFDLEKERVLVVGRSPSAGRVPAPEPPPFVSAGRFGLVGLAGLKETLGPRWPALEERVRALAEALVTRHLSPGDVFEVNEDGDYVVLFAHLDQAAAEFKCRVISREITARLLGSDSPRLADVASVAVQISRGALASANMEAVFAEAFAAGETEVSSDPACPLPGAAACDGPNATSASVTPARRRSAPGSPAESMRWGRSEPDWQLIQGGETLSSPTLGVVNHLRAGAGEAPDWRGVPPPEPRNAAALSIIDTRRPEPSTRPAWRSIRPEQRLVTPSAARAQPPLPSLVDQKWRYAPVWDFKKMSLIRFRLSSGVRGPATETTEEQALEAAAVFRIDLHGLSRATRQLSDLIDQGRRLSVICVISGSSVGRLSRRDQVLQLLRDAPPSVRRLLGLEIQVNDFTATYALREFVVAAEALGVRCGLSAPLGEAAARTVEVSLGACAVAVSDPTTEREALQTLGAFGAACSTAQRDSAAHGLCTRALVIGAVAAGVRFLSGAAVHGDLEDLSTGLRFEPADLYRDLLVGRRA